MIKKIVLGMILGIGILFAQAPFSGKIILLDQNATDPVYILPLKKYDKWLCEAELKNKKKIQFVSVKSMMQVAQHEPYFKKHGLLSAGIDKLYVQDFNTGRRIDATKAVYVFGSRITGPHGDDLIPFESETNAKLFMMKNGGTKILPFTKLSKGLIRYLDM
ncbi:nitrous oxide reductase accessory protein NosL [Sulfurovum sp.]|uniref:nitrous oxide reductase accessory protein NosL n=1 Tax=Sulfurovum sp. TaxID=1969726 RepID=UPI0025D1AC62|nr:nitrous oxide reductase accessory protein NosL [Sulfurovum sp.]